MMKRAGVGLLVGLLSLFPLAGNAEQFNSQTRVIVATGPGGNLVDHARRVSAAGIRGEAVRFSGQCGSACTLYLTLPASQMCLEPDAHFVFHAAYGAAADVNQWGSDFMMERYPHWVRSWVEAQGGLSSRHLHMSNSFAAQYIPACTGVAMTERASG